MNAPNFFEMAPHFYGVVYDPALDGARLRKQLRRVFGLMHDGIWRTLHDIADATGDPHASVSAQLRPLRKRRFGAYAIEKRRRGRGGTYEYRLQTPRSGRPA